jgi:hypothetical protein
LPDGHACVNWNKRSIVPESTRDLGVERTVESGGVERLTTIPV